MNFLDLKIPPIGVTMLFGFGMWIAARQTPSLTFLNPWRTVLALSLAAVGLALGVMGVLAFYHSRTSVNPFRPTETSKLVTGGVYRISRNPMYLGLLLTLAGWGIILSNFLAIALLLAYVAYMNRFQIIPEERALLTKFRSEFSIYRRSVRRWL